MFPCLLEGYAIHIPGLVMPWVCPFSLYYYKLFAVHMMMLVVTEQRIPSVDGYFHGFINGYMSDPCF